MEKEIFSRQQHFNPKQCKEHTSLSEKRKHLESSWLRVVETDISLKKSLSIQKDKLKSYQNSSTELGPSSLPTGCVMNYQIEERKLKELRRYHQEDCDELLFRNEALTNEISRNSC